MYPKNSYLEKRSPSPTFVNITTTPFDYNLPSEQTTNNHHHHHHHNHQHQNRHQQNHNKNFAHGSLKFAKTKAGLVSGTATTNIDKTELIYPEDAYSIEFCMPNDVTCKCPPTISSQTGISATTTYRDSTRRKSKNKPEISNRWTRKTSNNCLTDHHHHIEQHHQSTTATSADDHEILNLDNYCSPKQLQPPIYDVYSYAYLEPSPQQQQQQQILDQTQLQQHHPLHKHHHHHQNKQASTSSTTSTTSSSSSTSFMPIYGGGGPSTSSGGSTSSSSKSPSRNSIKALLAKSFRNRANITNNSHSSLRSNSASAATSATNSSNNIISTEKYTFTTRYGTTENLYEEVNDDKIRDILTTEQIINQQQHQPSTSQMSSILSSSPPQPPPINSKEEQRRVQNNHFRILDELNLSLEALIMPPTPPDISPTSGIIINQEHLLNGSKSVENISSALSSIDFKENIKERFYKTRNKIDCILKDNGGGSSICSGSGLVTGDIDSGLSVSDGSSCCNNDNNYKNKLDDNRRFATTMMMSSNKNKHGHNNFKNNYNNCNNDNHSNSSSGIAMTLISPSSPFKSMKRYFDGNNTHQQKLSSPNEDCGGVDVKTKNSNKFWTIRQ